MRTIIRRNCSVVFAVWCLSSTAISAENSPSQPISFIRDVAPILVTNCQACHGSKTAESNYRLDTFEAMMRPGDFGTEPVAPGDPDDSELYRLITAENPEERMPNNGGRLADVAIEIIANWIRQGAKFDGQNGAASLREQIPRDIPHPAAPQRYPSRLPITAMAFDQSGKQLVVGGYHELLIFDPATGTLMTRVGNIPQRIFDIAFSPDGSWLAVAGGAPGVSGEVRLIPWGDGPRTNVEPRVFATHDDVFFAASFRPDGERLAASGTDGVVRVFDVASGAEQLVINSHADWLSDICFSPDGKYIATASRDKTAKVFDADTGSLLATHSEHNAYVRAVAFTPDSKSVVSAGGNRIRIWNVADSKLVGEISGLSGDVHAVAIGDGSLLATADRSARHFKLSDRALVRELTPHPTPVLSLAWHETTSLVATGSFDGTVTVWALENGNLVKQFIAVPHAAASSAD